MSLTCAKRSDGAAARTSAAATRRSAALSGGNDGVVLREPSAAALRRSGAGSTLMRRGHCIRRHLISGACREHCVIDVAHFLDLHPQFDDLELVDPGLLVGPIALLPFAQSD